MKEFVSDRKNLVVGPKPEARTQSFVSVGDALSASFGAVGIELAPGGAGLGTDIGKVSAYARAAALEIPQDKAKEYIERAAEKIRKSLSQCDSPIERALLPALIFANYGHLFASFPAVLHCPKVDKEPPKGDLVVIPQFAFVRYRLDFGIVCEVSGRRTVFGIECDGEAFHNDATKDRNRDAYLQSFGIETFRFSGSEIFADPTGPANKVATLIAAWRSVQA